MIMMRGIRSTVAYFCLGLTLLSGMPRLLHADDKRVVAARWSEPGAMSAGFQTFDLERCLPTSATMPERSGLIGLVQLQHH
jgi:hypothetical protein